MRFLLSATIALCGFIAAVSGAKAVMRDGAHPPVLGNSQEWIDRMKSIAAVVYNDTEWNDSLHEMFEANKEKVVNLCDVAQLSCNTAGEIEAITLSNVRGMLDWSALPSTVKFVSVSDSNLSSDLTLNGLPDYVQSLHFFNVKFAKRKQGKSRAATHAGLRDFSCEGCGLVDINWIEFALVTSLNLAHNDLRTVPLHILSKSLRVANFSYASKHVDVWGSLPPSLVLLDLSGTQQTRIGDLPPGLEFFSIADNSIEGELNAHLLPESLVGLDVSRNKLTGEFPSLSRWKKLTSVDFSHNQITSFSWTELPPALSTLICSHNKLEGDFHFTSLPGTLITLDISFNAFSGEADLTHLPPNMAYLNIESNKFSGPIDFTAFPATMRFVYAQNNEFTGRPDLSKLPLELRRIFFGGNKWTSLMPPL